MILSYYSLGLPARCVALTLTAQLRELLGVGPIPPEAPPETGGEEQPRKTFASDVPYRQAAVEYEHKAGRYAETKDAGQPGYDIDSFDKPLDDPSRRLARRIEVKRHGCEWTQDDTVELSDRQFLDAVEGTVDDHINFDYWLYVVERFANGTLNVIPIKNPSRHAAKFEFRARTWRALAEQRESG